jgi:molybdopterin/thiamine biosynthesis adenylyltransferase
MALSEQQYQRYARQMVLPEIGAAGQERLLSAKVLVVGAGGLGSPVLQFLAGAGVGHLAIIDPDVVDRSNLHRQVIHRESTLGQPKVDSAAASLHDLNPDVHITRHPVYLTEENALELIERVDAVVDGSDNFATRYLTNDACFFRKKPLFYGAVARFEGQVSVFAPGQGESPCYRCLFSEPPPPHLARPCREVGVLGVLPGLIGTIQATECVKWILGLGRSLVGRVVTYDALALRFHEIRLTRDPDCALCGDHPTLKSLADYDWRACESAATPPHLL